MKLIFVGLMYSPYDKLEIKSKTLKGFQEPADTFQWSFINGLINNNCFTSIELINVVPTGTYLFQYKKILTESKKWLYNGFKCDQIGCLNIPIIKQLHRYFKLKEVISNKIKLNTEPVHIVFYSLYPPFILLSRFIKKLNNDVQISIIVPDLPSKFGVKSNSFLMNIISKFEGIFVLRKLEVFDYFVLLTKHMIYPLNISHKPYVVIEGLFDRSLDSIVSNIDVQNTKSILYSGSLNKVFGICDLIEAFRLINNSDVELFICGSGDCEEFVKQSSAHDKRIKYFGNLDRNQVLILQSKVNLLVNPRKEDSEYVKYSFPSKTMEYIFSGKPVLMHKLSCLPDDYSEHLFFFKSSNIESMKSDIIKILNMDINEVTMLESKNKKWILENKTAEKQTLKFIKLIKKDC